MIIFNNHKLVPRTSFYSQDKNVTALYLLDAEDGQPYCVLSVNMEGYVPDEGCIWLKSYSENEDIALFMISEGYLELTGKVLQGSYVNVPEARMTEKLLNLLKVH